MQAHTALLKLLSKTQKLILIVRSQPTSSFMSLWDLMQLAGPPGPSVLWRCLLRVFPLRLFLFFCALSLYCFLWGSAGFLHLTLSLFISCSVHFSLPCALIPGLSFGLLPCSRLLQVTTSLWASQSEWSFRASTQHVQDLHCSLPYQCLFPFVCFFPPFYLPYFCHYPLS